MKAEGIVCMTTNRPSLEIGLACFQRCLSLMGSHGIGGGVHATQGLEPEPRCLSRGSEALLSAMMGMDGGNAFRHRPAARGSAAKIDGT